jgi:SAM-dependent methyltransferase
VSASDLGAGKEPAPPSPFLAAWLDALAAAAGGAPVIDLACGRGRNALPVAARGLRVVGVDRSAELLRELTSAARQRRLRVSGLRADLESAPELPLRAGSCGGILVFRFLFRPLAPRISACLRPGGLLLYETFTTRQPELGWGPRNAAFLLRPGELRGLFPDLETLDTWEGIASGERPEAVARLAARRRGGANVGSSS